MELTVEFRETQNIRFTVPIMSSAHPPIKVTQSIGGAFIRVEYDGRCFEVAVEQLAVALVEAVSR